MYERMKYSPVAKTFYDGLSEGRFLGLRCPACGHIEFPPYPACNECGTFEGMEWVDLADAEVTVHEIYAVSPMMTIDDFTPYAPCFSCEATMEGGVEFTCMVFGVTKQTYPELREQVPLKARLVKMPMTGYDSFAVSIGGAVPQRKEAAATMDQTQLIQRLGLSNKDVVRDNGFDGTYEFQLKALGRTRDGEMTIFVSEDDPSRCTGTVDAMDQKLAIVGGTRDGGHFEFTVEASGAELAFKGDIATDGTLTGQAKFGAIKMKMTGKRI